MAPPHRTGDGGRIGNGDGGGTGNGGGIGSGDGGGVGNGAAGERGRARQLFRYLGGEEWQEYRAILSVFAGTFFAEFTSDDVAAHQVAADAGLDADAVAARLESLRRWGNLTVSSSIGAPASLDDYYRRRNRYLITRAGQEVHELVEGVLAGVDEIGDVQAGRLRDLHLTLEELAAQLDAGAGGEELADRVRRIFDLHERFTSELTQFFAELNQWQNRYDLDAGEVQLFATVLVGYVSEKLSEIERMTRPIARGLEAILTRLDDLLPALRTGLAARVDDAGLAADVPVRRLKGTDPADWEHLAAWFRPPPGRPSRLDQLTRQAVAAVRTLTANVTRLSRAGLGAASRRADFVKLAGFFDRATSAGDAHRIAAAAFGLGSCRRIGAPAADADDPVPTVTPWREAPRATVAVSLRIRGDRSQRGLATPVRDRRTERAWIRQRRERERVAREAVAAELLESAGEGGLLDGAQLSVASFTLLRDLLGRSGHGYSPGATVRAATADGVRCEVRRIEGVRTVVECPEGRLALGGLEVAVGAGPGAPEPARTQASATGVAT
ncbi:MAG: TIGR02677 family protein [bacterium]|nr:TIGR02677 family protein [bacterium]